jgi:hypothetical protein
MILYKYYSFKAGLTALKSKKLGFRIPTSFNDPFEVSVFEEESSTNRIDDLVKNVAILSLTRTALNPLMWAHYGEEHRGFVIGYEVDDPFFLSNQFNLIPLRKGNVIYTKTKPFQKISKEDARLLNLAVYGFDDDLSDDTKQLIDHLFLNKDTIWSYEEEVRIVKRLSNLTIEEFSQHPYNFYSNIPRKIRNSDGIYKEKIKGLKIFNYPVKIKEIYLGNRNSFLEKSTVLNTEGLKKLKKYIDQETMIFYVSKDQESWNLNRNLINIP